MLRHCGTTVEKTPFRSLLQAPPLPNVWPLVESYYYYSTANFGA